MVILVFMAERKKICVFCSSNDALDQTHRAAARLLGRLIGEAGFDLIWGGCDIASMGDVARGVQEARGQAIGVITQHFIDRGLAFRAADELILAPDLHERKKLMQQRADGFIILPGGFGTLDELFHVFTEQIIRMKAGKSTQPIVILNWASFFDGLGSFFEHLYREKVADESYRSLYYLADSPDSAVGYLRQSL